VLNIKKYAKYARLMASIQFWKPDNEICAFALHRSLDSAICDQDIFRYVDVLDESEKAK
jgi:hypothetical protein